MRRTVGLSVGGAVFALLPAFVLSLGCPVPLSHQVMQSSTIPLPTPTPPPSSRGVSDLYVGASTLTVAEPGPDSGGSNTSLYLPRTQLEMALSFHHAVFGWRALGGVSLGEGPAVSDTPLPRAPGTPGFAGVGMDVGFFDETERFSLQLTLEGLAGFATSVQRFTTLFADGTVSGPGTRSGVDLVGIFGMQVSAGYWATEWLRVMGGVGFRSSPSNEATFTAPASGYSGPPSGVNFGDIVGLVWLGAELRLPFSDDVAGALVPYVSWPFAGGPITYGPTVAIGMRITFGSMRGATHVDWESVTPYGSRGESETEAGPSRP